jgi:uncharacterized protein YbjQ (UPF0145 family)
VPFWSRQRPTEEEEQRRDASLAAIEQGGIPIEAQERLDELRARGGGFFTSDLSVSEFLLTREAGFRAVSQVMGSSFYQVGWQRMPWAGSWSTRFGSMTQGGVAELEVQSEAWNDARRLALGRLAEEARRAGAQAVAGVRLEQGTYAWGQSMVEFTAVGTALSSDRYDLGDDTVLSNLSGQDFSKLFRHGYWPVGLVAATTVCYVVAGWQTQNALSGGFFGGGWRNQELTDFTEGLYQARFLAMTKVQRQARELGAHGIVGVVYDQTQHEHEVETSNDNKRTDLIVTLHVLGTAIAEVARAEEPPATYIALPLD